jgi:hypothetical protein
MIARVEFALKAYSMVASSVAQSTHPGQDMYDSVYRVDEDSFHTVLQHVASQILTFITILVYRGRILINLDTKLARRLCETLFDSRRAIHAHLLLILFR